MRKENNRREREQEGTGQRGINFYMNIELDTTGWMSADNINQWTGHAYGIHIFHFFHE